MNKNEIGEWQREKSPLGTPRQFALALLLCALEIIVVCAVLVHLT